uniref:NADH-ubiquinone oxidoreductase chain 1 n=1 Tax=Blattisocius tarsalis TaxID=1609195 RepID=A0A6B9WDJ1_9ACAR|nr:NADH dehydrogenase subunit 1 [Blattisocius tarsalis]QHQ98573.1 NADH dehydrogenase subunit 1 [Blattisocius tarsalis]
MMYIMLFMMVMLSIAFITLLERKLLGYMQLRKGPNKIMFMGLIQPLSDGVKLFLKENNLGFNMSGGLFMCFPLLLFFLMGSMWFVFSYVYMHYWVYEMLVVVMLSGLSVYGVLGMGWSSNANYALMGSYRSVVQTVSYEVCLVFVLMSVMFMSGGYSLGNFEGTIKNSIWLMVFCWGLMVLWVLVMMAELNRAPFDFVEGESELVSGFNVEYGGLNFALIFLAEYGNMIFFSYLSVLMFFQVEMMMLVVFLMSIIWVRGTFPRYRYDSLMSLTWKRVLPLILLMFYVIFMVMLMM